MAETWGGLVESRENCAYCAAWPSLPCALHREFARKRLGEVAVVEIEESKR